MQPYYERGGITIYHGDCRDVLPQLWQCAADLLLTDPPYGIAYRHGSRRGGVRLGMDGVTVAGDMEPFDPSHLLGLAPRLILWGANHYADKLPPSAGWLIWDKRQGVGINDQSDCELAWTNFLTTARVYYRRWNGALRGGREQREKRYHVSQKPVSLLSWCIQKADGHHIIDPYMGSGSSLLAAKELGCTAIGIEVEERYCEIAARRLSQEVMPLVAAGD